MDERQKIMQEIVNQKALLSSGESNIGDWKVIKCYEARLQDNELPYDINDLMAKRAAVRRKINELEAQLEA